MQVGRKDLYPRLRRWGGEGGVKVVAGDGWTGAADSRTPAPLAAGPTTSRSWQDPPGRRGSSSLLVCARPCTTSCCSDAARHLDAGDLLA